jgi:CRISPR-associated protein (TIGR02584 family)
MTPQIITETLFALTQQHDERVDEIRVITTLKGRDRVVRDLLHPHTGRFIEFCKDFGIDRASIKFDESTITVLRKPDGENFDDLRLGPDNEVAADQICEIVRELAKQPNTRIHASAAGGRKTMGFYLMAAMQLFGRPQDRLSHVLVSEEFEGTDFYYKPPVNRELKKRDGASVFTDNARIDLALIPFIRLRGARSEWLRTVGPSYVQTVNIAQEYLDRLDSAKELRLDLAHDAVIVEGQKVTLSEREFFIYLMFSDFRRNNRGEAGFVRLDEITRGDLDSTFRRITKARGFERGLEDWQLVAGYAFLEKLITQVSETKTLESTFRKPFDQICARIKRKLDAANIPRPYCVQKLGKRGESPGRFGIPIASDLIVFDEPM